MEIPKSLLVRFASCVSKSPLSIYVILLRIVKDRCTKKKNSYTIKLHINPKFVLFSEYSFIITTWS